MNEIWTIIQNAYTGYANYLWLEITKPSWHNYFYALTAISLIFFLLEIASPWRKKQAMFRKDFWLDTFYMYFNFFLFSLIIYNAGSDVVVHFIRRFLSSLTNIDFNSWNPMRSLPLWAVFLIGFIVRDFVQWWIHRLLHRVPFLWKFHQVHHSVKEMGFAAHLRFHWMETVVYRTIEYLPLAFLGIGLYDFYIIHLMSLVIGHYNHANMSTNSRIMGAVFGGFIGIIIGLGGWDTQVIANPTNMTGAIGLTIGCLIGAVALAPFMRYFFNHPEMHIWHHAKELPNSHRFGVNFGLSLAIWDYIFSTAYIPHNGRDIELGFPKDEGFPQSFGQQAAYGFISHKDGK